MSRFRLRALLIVVTLIAIYLANASRNASWQKRFIERVDTTGGYARYDWQYANMAFNPDAVPPQPQWLWGVVDKNYFMQVKHVFIFDFLTDSDVQWLAHTRCVTELDVDVSKSHHLLRQLGSQKQLRCLRIRASGELDLSFLNEMPNLELLNIEGAILRDITSVASLRALTFLRTAGCDLSNLEVEAFRDMKQLTFLHLHGGDWTKELDESKFAEIHSYLPKCTVQ